MLQPACYNRVIAAELARQSFGIEHAIESGYATVGVSNYGKRVRRFRPQMIEAARPFERVVLPRDRVDCIGIFGARGLDGIDRSAGGKEGFPDHGIFEKVKHVGRIAPQIGGRRCAHLSPQLIPGCPAISEMAAGIG